MPYEFYLESENEKRMFTEKNWREMQEYITNFPHYKVNDRLYYIFENDERKKAAVPGILSKIANSNNIYTHPCIGFNSASVLISVVGDNDVDRYLYDFVVWCQKRMFTKETLEEMHKYISNNLPHFHIEDWFYYIFKDNNDYKIFSNSFFHT